MTRRIGPQGPRWTPHRTAVLNYLWGKEEGGGTAKGMAVDLEIDASVVRYNLARLEVESYVTRRSGQMVRQFDDLLGGATGMVRAPDLWRITDKGSDKAKHLSLLAEQEREEKR